MKNNILTIKNLVAGINGQEILQGLDLEINAGEVHAIMGPNGSGKSTLSNILAGKPGYEIFSGDILFKGESILDLNPTQRACLGIFLAFQYPVEIPGVNNAYFLRSSLNAILKSRGEEEIDAIDFLDLIKKKLEFLKIDEKFLHRSINEGFSGGEKKRNEILQMAVLNPLLSVLDETDSGLDIDALKICADGINSLHSSENATLMITHYQRLLDYVKPDFVHVLVKGKIVKSGTCDLALKLESEGYDQFSGGESLC